MKLNSNLNTKLILEKTDSPELFSELGGGKAKNLARMSALGFDVPDWFCVSATAFRDFLALNQIEIQVPASEEIAAYSQKIETLFEKSKLPAELEKTLSERVQKLCDANTFVAVRSSGLDEDSAENSFAGQFSSYLFQKGMANIELSLKRCWASGFSERALQYRLERGLSVDHIGIGVVIQKMVNANSAGVAFSRNPIRPLDRDSIIVDSVWGLGEGLVSGELDADHFEYHREKKSILSKLAEKSHALRQAPEGGLFTDSVSADLQKQPSLSEAQVKEVARMAQKLEEILGSPQDCEWAFENGKLFCLQTRPVTTLPPASFFENKLRGEKAILWDNSNIIESYSGVTSPLTFSFASAAYRQVYIQFCEVMGVSKRSIQDHEEMFANMLGLIRGRIYYNLGNWYKLVLMLPGAGNNKGFMETMMGVKQSLKPETASVFDFVQKAPQYSFLKNLSVTVATLFRFLRIRTIVSGFQSHFDKIYQVSRKIDFKKQSLTDQAEHYRMLYNEILTRWHAPIINDYLCMIFFGLLKKLTEKWVGGSNPNDVSTLQNDLLCGQGDLESTEPTKMLMRIAKKIDLTLPAVRQWILSASPSEIWQSIQAENPHPEFKNDLDEFLDRYGFRCVNELKLEEPDLHDDPSFVINAVASYIRMKSYSIESLEAREKEIKHSAEAKVRAKLGGWKLPVYFWILKQTRFAVRNRENLRFARTKIFGVVRHLFRGMGENFAKLNVLEEPKDIFYLTVEEIFSFIEGRALSSNLKGLISIRKPEFKHFDATLPPPDRFLSTGAVGLYNNHIQVLLDSDLTQNEPRQTDDPNLLFGTPCCPGIVEGVIRVAASLKDAEGLNGEILVTGRTDPGWVPLYPSCSGLLIERGSLLSHSAVVARELGLPTIVGISGGLMSKLKTGQRVRIDAGRGEVRILP